MIKRLISDFPWYHAIRWILGLLFIYGGMAKLDSNQEYADDIHAYQILPDQTIGPISLTLPIFEIVCGICTLSGFCIRKSTLAIILMLTAFLLASLSAMVRGLNIDCGCFGALYWFGDSPAQAVFRDAALLLISVVLYTHLSNQRDKIKT